MYLNKIEEYAKILMLPTDIAVLIDVDLDTFIENLKDSKTEEYHSFYKGYLETKKRIHELLFIDDKNTTQDEIALYTKQLQIFEQKLNIQLHA